MQPTPLYRILRPDSGSFTRSSYPPSPLQAAWRDAPSDDGAPDLFAADQSPDEADGASTTLDDVARREREDMRPRLRDELGREPTEEELDEWLRRHTEGY